MLTNTLKYLLSLVALTGLLLTTAVYADSLDFTVQSLQTEDTDYGC